MAATLTLNERALRLADYRDGKATLRIPGLYRDTVHGFSLLVLHDSTDRPPIIRAPQRRTDRRHCSHDERQNQDSPADGVSYLSSP